MGTISANLAMTWAEAHKRQGFDELAAVLGELAQQNDFMDECPWHPSTHGAYNKQLQGSRLGKGAFTMLNGPVPAITSGTEEITEPVKMYEADSMVDERALLGVKDAYVVRDSEDGLNLAGIIQDWLYNLIYSDLGDTPDSLKSFTKRRPKLLVNRVWGAGGTGSDVTSLWLFEFSKRGLYLVHGNDNAGLTNEDRGKWRVPVPVGTGQMWAWLRHFAIWAGIVLRDDRALLRMANIESAGSANIFDPAVFITMKNRLPSVGRNAVAFVNRDVKGQLDNQAYAKTNIFYSLREIENYGPITFIADVPVRMMEAILSTETAITA
jgi:hypothetical protein